MSSNIDQIIEEIEDYIESCKFQPLSSTKIVVNKDEIQELIQDLRQRTPEEVKRYQKIISNKEAILADAQAKADAIISQAKIKKDELLREHQIMQQAYEQANQVVTIAQNQAQEIMDQATNDANQIRMNAISYTDQMLSAMEDLLTQSQSIFKTNFAQLSVSMQQVLEVITANRAELRSSDEGEAPPEQDHGEMPADGQAQTQEGPPQQ